ncbi:putative F-box protein At1g47730 [Raphanus sativus]|uniref:F-box protein At1g47730 n=1 Tax=Raphanus sativus TaxID=3726 RepID=A0A9W3DES6_RAPSA|nr:putative F-box protein At1g47730 [Raphanus sativus]
MGEQQDGEMKRGSKRSKGASLHVDLIWEVLLRLPSKSIVQSRCMSKLFSSLTTQPDFIRSFAARSSPCLLILFEVESKLFVFSLSQQQQQNKNPAVAHVVDRSYSMLCPDRYFFFNSESVHGLICVEKLGHPQIWNPTTRRFSTLPIPARSWKDGSVSFLGYDPVDSTYKVLSLSCDGRRRPRKPRALTLGGDGAGRWRVIEGVPEHAPFPFGALCVNGVLYYLAAPTSPEHYTNQSLACFHVRSEKLSMIKVPWNLTSGFRSLVHCGNKLTCLVSLGDDLNMWTLEHAEKHEWSHRHVCLPFPRHDPVSKTRFTFRGVNGAGEFMYVPLALANPFHIIYFDPKGNSFRRCVVDGVADEQFRRLNGLRDKPLPIASAYSNHVETLMTL